MRTTASGPRNPISTNAFRAFPPGRKNSNWFWCTGGQSACSPERGAPSRLDLVLRTLKVAFTLSSEIGLWMQYRFSKSGDSQTDERKRENRMKLTSRNVITKLYAVAALAATLMGATLLPERTVKVAAAAPPTGTKNVVLVHGAFADGSGWEAVAKILEKDGYTISV